MLEKKSEVVDTEKALPSSAGVNEVLEDTKGDKKLIHMGLATALSIAIHNFPEGLATYVGAVLDPAGTKSRGAKRRAENMIITVIIHLCW